MINKKKNAGALCVLLALNVQGQLTKSKSGFHHIESVVADHDCLYAADIGAELNPTAKDGDGIILKLDLHGNILDSSCVNAKLNAPKGLVIDHGILYLTDIDRIVAVRLKTGDVLYEIDLSKDASFLNDIAVWDKKTLFVSATDKNTIFKINLTDKSYAALKVDSVIAGVNGLVSDQKGNRLYVNGFGSNNLPNGQLGFIDLQNGHFNRLTALEGYFDGLILQNGLLYTSNWVAFEKKGMLFSIRLSDNQVTELNPTEPIAGPADFIIRKDQLIVPAMMDGSIQFIPLIK